MFAFAILVTILFGAAILATLVAGYIDEHNKRMECARIRHENQAMRIANSR